MNRAQIIIFGVVGVLMLVLVLVVFGVIPGLKQSAPQKFTLTVWGFEDEHMWFDIAQQYKSLYSYINVAYVKKDPDTYENDLLNALASGSGPDIFVLKNSEITKHGEKIFPLPQNELSFQTRDFKNTFFDAAAGDLITKDGDIIGIPLTVEPLALFYNRDLLNSANIVSSPATWEDLVAAVKKLTSYSEVGTVTRSGIAFGTSANVLHSTDILASLFIQSGIQPFDRVTGKSGLLEIRPSAGIQSPAESALDFYTSFADSTKRTYSWSGSFPDSLTSFAQEKTAMMVGYPSDYPAVVSKNPHLNFDVAPFPQPANAAVTEYYARYSFETVSKQSQHAADAWRFLMWLSDHEHDKAFADTLLLPPSRRDLVQSKPPRDYFQVFYNEVLSSKTWFIPDEDKIRSIFQEMIDSVVNKTSTAGEAVGRADTRINNLSSQ